jgi:hypothetical protein
VAKLESSSKKKNKKEVEIGNSTRQAVCNQLSVDVRVDTARLFAPGSTF